MRCASPGPFFPTYFLSRACLGALMQSFAFNWFLAVLLCCMPLWCFHDIPATDLPQHAAISSIAFRLWQHDPNTTLWYTWNIQPVPYYLAYLGLIPAVGFLGPIVGPKLFLHLLAATFLHAWGLCTSTLHKPHWALLLGVFIYYNAFFFWGFLTTLVGYVLLLYFLWALTRYLQTSCNKYALLASLFGFLTTCSHATLLLSCGVCTFLFVCQNPKKYFLVACWIALLTLLPALPFFYDIAQTRFAHSTSALSFSTGNALWNHVRCYFGAFDRSLGRNMHQLVFGVCVFCLPKPFWQAVFSKNQAVRFWLLVMCAHLVLFVTMPLAIETAEISAWLLNGRYLVIIELSLVLCALPTANAQHRRWAHAATTVATGVFFGALCNFWQAFDHKAQEFQPVLAQLQDARCLDVQAQPIFFAQAWPPVLSHLYAYHVALRGGYQRHIFSSGHLPIAERHAGQSPPCPVDMLLLQNQDLAADPTWLHADVRQTSYGAWTVLRRSFFQR